MLTAPFPKRSVAWTVVGILTLATILSYIDRQLINLLVDPIRSDLGLTDTQISILQGPAFILFYLFAGLPAGRLADVGNRRNLIIGGVLIWSTMTMLCGLATGFWELFAARAGVGIGEACLAPAAYSLISDCVEKGMRGRAMSLVALSAPLGSGLSFILGGAILAAMPDTGRITVPVFGNLAAWQACFIVAGLPGALIAALLLLVPEVPRLEVADAGNRNANDLPAALQQQRSLLVPFFLSVGLLALAAYAMTAWKASYYVRVLGVAPDQAGIILGLVAILGNVFGGFLGGWLSDYFARSGRPAGRTETLVVATFLSIPAIILWLSVSDVFLSFAALAILHVTIGLGVASAPSILNDFVTNNLRGRMVAVMGITSAILGAGMGPFSAALVSDYIFGENIRMSLLTLLPLVCSLALLLSLIVRKNYALSKTN